MGKRTSFSDGISYVPVANVIPNDEGHIGYNHNAIMAVDASGTVDVIDENDNEVQIYLVQGYIYPITVKQILSTSVPQSYALLA